MMLAKHLRDTIGVAVALLFIPIGLTGLEVEKAEAQSQAQVNEDTGASPTYRRRRRRRPGSGTESGRRREGVVEVGTTKSKRDEDVKVLKEQGIAEPGLAAGQEFFEVENRWNMFYEGKWYDPYNQNILKGDLPIFGSPGNEWFFEILAESETLVELRNVPTPTSLGGADRPGRNDVIGDGDQLFFNELLLFEFNLIKGNTTFKPQDLEFSIAPVLNFNYVNVEEAGVLKINPSRGTTRDEFDLSLAALFVDIHLLDLNPRYDFVSLRLGVQEFNADFRGFLFIDSQPGVRLFGNYDNNKIQWNLAWFSRLLLNSNSLLPKLFEFRKENLYIANVYLQDIIALGHTVELLALHRVDRFGDEGQQFDDNGFIAAPASIGSERKKEFDVTYLGLNSEGHFDRLNVSSTFYWALGEERENPISNQDSDISAFFAALELSYDIDWLRPKFSFLWASGDDDPLDGDSGGFDTIQDFPVFAGGEFSYWQRQAIPFIGGGGVLLTNRFSQLNSLRAGKEQGQSNFVNPGLILAGVGLDVDVLPELILENNINYLRFADTSSLEATRQDGSIDEEIGLDISSGFIYRPFLNNNVQINFGVAALIPGDGAKNLYGDKTLWQGFSNLILLY